MSIPLFIYVYIRIEHRGSGDLLLSNQKREKRDLSRERGINGLVRERLVGLCRESPFTASGSEATFAVTDGQLNQVNNHQPAEKTNESTALQKQN